MSESYISARCIYSIKRSMNVVPSNTSTTSFSTTQSVTPVEYLFIYRWRWSVVVSDSNNLVSEALLNSGRSRLQLLPGQPWCKKTVLMNLGRSSVGHLLGRGHTRRNNYDRYGYLAFLPFKKPNFGFFSGTENDHDIVRAVRS